MTHRELLLVAALCCAGAAVWTAPTVRAAETQPETSATGEDATPTVRDEIVVSANFAPTERADVGSTVTVLGRDDIERHRWPTVADALRTVPGVSLARSGGPGQVTSVFVRGGSSSQALVLIDGLRINSATTGAVDFADLLTDGVERIEVLRGPQSTLYGSEAASGVISILTGGQARSPGTRVTGLVEAGEDEHLRARFGVAGASSRVDGELSASLLDTDEVSAADVRRGNTETDRHENRTVSARLGGWLGEPSDSSRLDVTVRHVDGDVEVDGFSFFDGPVDDLDATNAREALFTGVQTSIPVTRRWSQSLRVGWADDTLTGADPTNPFNSFEVESRRLEIESRAELALGTDHVASLGASFERREGAFVGSFEQEVDLVAVYAQDRWALSDGATLSLGVRRDDHEQFGGETTWRLAAAWRPGGEGRGGGRWHGSWGTGFKAPTFNDLYFPGFGNPELAPETTEAFDLGYEHSLAGERLLLDVTYFDIDFEDLIAFDFTTFLPENIAAARSRGVEASASWRGAALDLRAAYTWNDTEDEATGEQLARRPEHRVMFDVGLRVGDRLRLAAAAWADRDRIDSDGSELEDLERLDLTAQWVSSGRGQGFELEPYLRVLNVFDDEASEIGGFGSRGRTAMLGLSASWGG
ncbi:MAG: TonB-dependent receptor [Acidobacteriota bacterium]